MAEPVVNPYRLCMAEPDLTTLTHRLANLTRRAMAHQMAMEQWALDAGFRPGCVGALFVLEAVGPMSQKELSERLLLDPSDLVSLVDILERAGLVDRRRDPADRRRYALELTDRGRIAAQRLHQVSRTAQESVLEPLDEQERRSLAELLERVVFHHSGLVTFEGAGPIGDAAPAAEVVSDRAGAARRSDGS